MDEPGRYISHNTYLAAAKKLAVVVCKTLPFHE